MLEEIKIQAEKEISDEDFRAAVDTRKAMMRATSSFWQRVIPFKITFKWKHIL